MTVNVCVRRSFVYLSCVAVIATSAACGGGGDDLSADQRTTTSDESDDVVDRTTTFDVDTTSTTGAPTVTPEGLDLAATPALVSLTGPVNTGANRIVRFEHAARGPEIVVESAGDADLNLSPDLRYVAITSPGDAVRGGALEIVGVIGGEVEASFEVDADEISVQQWSPDSSAVLLWQRKSGDVTYGAYRADGTEAEIESDGPVSASRIVWGEADGTIQPLSWSASGTVPFTLVTTDGELVNVTAGYNVEHGRYDMASGRITPYGAEYYTERSCGRFALLARTATEREVALFDADSGDIVSVGRGELGRDCPIISNDGTLAAVEFNGSVTVLDLASGTATQVARQGRPLAWGAGDTTLLVSGNGIFVVDADGSGGREASVELGNYACVAGTTGTVVAIAPNSDDLVRYDIANDSSEILGIGDNIQRDAICETSADGEWLLVNNTLVDLVGGHSSIWTPSASQLLEIERTGAFHFEQASSRAPSIAIVA